MYLHQTSLEIAHHQHAERLALTRKDHLIAEARAGHQDASRTIMALLAVRAFARRLRYDRPIEPSLAAFRGARASTAALLDRMTEEDWSRQGTHSESGPYSVMDWLERKGM